MTTDPGGWASVRAARRYRAQADMVPGRDEAPALIARLAVWRQPSRLRVLDLGCGTGEASAAVLALAPEASITMVDVSDEMLRRAAARFAGDARARLLKHDLGEGLPEPVREGPFDAVVSCFAFHHVAPARREVATSRSTRRLARTASS